MLSVGYEKIKSRHYRRHLVEPGAEVTLCGVGVGSLAHLPPILDPSSFLAIGTDAEVCKKCAARVKFAGGWHGENPPAREGDHWSEILGRMAAEGGHLVKDS